MCFVVPVGIKEICCVFFVYVFLVEPDFWCSVSEVHSIIAIVLLMLSAFSATHSCYYIQMHVVMLLLSRCSAFLCVSVHVSYVVFCRQMIVS